MSAVPTRRLGPAGLEVPAFSLGSWHTWDRAVFEEVVEIVRRTRELGAAMFDIGIYRAGFDTNRYDSPTDVLLGRAIEVAGLSRDEYLLSVKGWLGDDLGAGLATVVQQTLTRHGTDYADFVVLGGGLREEDYDAAVLVGRVKELVDAGTVRHWAINNWSVRQIREAQSEAERIGLEPPQYSQLVYSLFRRTIAEGEPVTTLCEETGLSIQASNIFEGGVVIGKGGERHTVGNYDGAHDAMNAAQKRLRDVAASFGATPSQLGFLLPLTNPLTANVLLGLRTLDQLDDIVGAFAVLARHDPAEIRSAAEEFRFDEGVDPAAGGA